MSFNPKPRWRWSVLATLAVMHLLLLLVLVHTLRSRQAHQAPQSIELSLVAERPPERVRARPMPLEAPPLYAPRYPLILPTPNMPTQTAGANEAAIPATLASPPAPAASAPLKLALPPLLNKTPTARDLAMQDPRSHSQKMSVEDHIADATGALPVTREASTDGTGGTIVRQGTKCTRVTPSRIGTLNPMDSRASSLPSVSGKC